MEPLTIDSLRTLASLRGLDLTDQELAELLPLVRAARSMMELLPDALSGDVEPAFQYRVL